MGVFVAAGAGFRMPGCTFADGAGDAPHRVADQRDRTQRRDAAKRGGQRREVVVADIQQAQRRQGEHAVAEAYEAVVMGAELGERGAGAHAVRQHAEAVARDVEGGQGGAGHEAVRHLLQHVPPSWRCTKNDSIMTNDDTPSGVHLSHTLAHHTRALCTPQVPCVIGTAGHSGMYFFLARWWNSAPVSGWKQVDVSTLPHAQQWLGALGARLEAVGREGEADEGAARQQDVAGQRLEAVSAEVQLCQRRCNCTARTALKSPRPSTPPPDHPKERCSRIGTRNDVGLL